jgi:hypothetical protein
MSVPVHPATVTSYVMLFAPIFADAGSNVPFAAFVIPVPLQVPPAVAAERFTVASLEQKSPGLVIVASGVWLTVISIWSESEHVPVPTL